jgi:hypothetical protein
MRLRTARPGTPARSDRFDAQQLLGQIDLALHDVLHACVNTSGPRLLGMKLMAPASRQAWMMALSLAPEITTTTDCGAAC